jgi:hypothetical protein
MIGNDFVRHIAAAIDRVPNSDQKELNAALLATECAFENNPALYSHLEEIVQKYGEGKRLAQQCGANFKDPETCLNFAYGIAMIGAEGVRKLHRATGVEYFMRYSKNMLTEAVANLDPTRNKDKPLLIAMNAKADHNGAFYRGGLTIDPLSKHYRVMLAESGSESEFKQRMLAIAQTYGKAHTVFLGGHGEANEVLLGPSTLSSDEQMLDTTDEDTIKAIKPALVANPTVILDSCSTARGTNSIAEMLSREWGARVYAPQFRTSMAKFVLAPDGAIQDVTFNTERSRYVSGTLSLH